MNRIHRILMAVFRPGAARDPFMRAQGYSRADEKAYDAHNEAELAEHEEFMAAGERDVCPKCGQRSVKHRDVVTLGYAGHPGAEHSDYAKCENCDYAAL